MNLRRLFILHGLITFAAGLVLVFFPQLIPSTVNITIKEEHYILCYFLAAAEFAIAYLSFYAARIANQPVARQLAIAMIIFHMTTLFLELVAFRHGLSPKILINVAARVIISGLFYYYGIAKRPR